MGYDREDGETVTIEVYGQQHEVRRHTSFGQVSLMARCGQRYYRDYILGLQDDFEKSLATEAGSAVHELLEEFEQLGGYDLDVDTMRDALRSIPDADSLKVWGKKDLRWWINKAAPKMVDFYNNLRAAEMRQGYEPVAWEYDVEYTTPDGQLFIGSVDRILFNEKRGHYVPGDWKTGKRKEQDKLQVDMYRRVLIDDGRFTPIEFSRVYYLVANHTETVLPSLMGSDLDRMVDDTRGGSYAYSGPLTGECDWCPHKPDCPVGSLGDSNVLLTK